MAAAALFFFGWGNVNAQNTILSCGFETQEELEGWLIVDSDGDGNGWNLGSSPSLSVHSGNYAAYSASYDNNTGALTPDNWLISPEITLPSGNITLSWWAAGQDAEWCDEHYAVMLSTTSGEPTLADFTETLYEDNSGSVYTESTVSLNAYAGQTVRIAFRHYNITDMFYLNIDDISITAGGSVGIANADNVEATIYPNPTSDKVNVAAEGLQSLELVDMTGRTIATSTTNSIDMSSFANGVYMLRVITNDGTALRKVVKQ